MNVVEPAEIFQVFYVSRSMATPAELQSILAACHRNNPARGLTGALLFTGGAFAQILEGPQSSVQAMGAIIEADRRHRGLRWLLQRGVAQRNFSDWSMKLLEAPGADDLVQQLLFGASVSAERADRLLTLMFGLPAAPMAPLGTLRA